MRPSIGGLPAVLLIAGAAMSAAADSTSDLQPELRALLLQAFRFSPSDLTALEKGKVVTHRLGASAAGEIAAVGAVLVKARKDTFVDRYRDIARFKRGDGVLEIGRFSDPPSLEDLASLTIGKQDVGVRTCAVGDCDIRLPAAAIMRFKNEIDWKAPDADARAAVLFKEILIGSVRAYVSGGPGRITEYDDDRQPVRPVDDFAGLLKGSPYVEELVPGLTRHLESYPSSHLPGAEDFLYWSKEQFGFTPFITVTHVTITRPSPASYVLASKDVYSSRYFDASLSLTIASDATTDPGAFYLVYVNRSRASGLKGAFAGWRRSIVARRARGSLEDNLRIVKARLESSK